MLTKLLILILLVLALTYIIYQNYLLHIEHRDTHEKLAQVFLEDVIGRIEELSGITHTLEKYRKIRESHATLESLAGIVGGHEELSKIIKQDVLHFDDYLQKCEQALSEDMEYKYEFIL